MNNSKLKKVEGTFIIDNHATHSIKYVDKG